jgi:hypothetical protein
MTQRPEPQDAGTIQQMKSRLAPHPDPLLSEERESEARVRRAFRK